MAASGILRKVSRYSFALCKFAYASSLSSLKAVASPVPIFASYLAAAASYLTKASYLHCAASAAALTAGAARAAGSASAASPAAADACAGTCGVDGEAGGGMRPPRRPEAAAAAKAGKPEDISFSVVLVDVSAEDIYWEEGGLKEEAAHTVLIRDAELRVIIIVSAGAASREASLV